MENAVFKHLKMNNHNKKFILYELKFVFDFILFVDEWFVEKEINDERYLIYFYVAKSGCIWYWSNEWDTKKRKKKIE